MPTRAYSYLRLSTPEQRKGDSQRRQAKLATAYALKHGLELVNKAYQDIGVSAFRGKNATDGAFGAFLDAIENGHVRPGEYLLVESLDRISRESPFQALSTFTRIIQNGIRIVTLLDEAEYSRETLSADSGLMKLFGSITILARANEESVTKSRRIKESWDARRFAAEKNLRPITTVCPAWLKFNNGKFEIIPERKALIEEIFALKLSGKGKYFIQRELNRRREPVWDEAHRRKDRPSVWHNSYIGRLLQNRQLIGEYQPHRWLDGKRVPSGSPIKGYYPVVIPEEQFAQVNGIVSDKRGRPSVTERNLFSAVIFCHCGSPIHRVDKGRGLNYLVCAQARYGRGCSYTSWRYEDFEQTFLQWLGHIPADALARPDNQKALRTLRDKANAIRGRLNAIGRELTNLTLIAKAGTSTPRRIADRMLELEKQEEHLKRDLNRNEFEQAKLSKERDIANVPIAELAGLFDSLKDISKRRAAKDEIANRITRIVLYPGGPNARKDFAENLTRSLNEDDSIPSVERLLDMPLFQVVLKSGEIFTIIPSWEQNGLPLIASGIDLNGQITIAEESNA